MNVFADIAGLSIMDCSTPSPIEPQWFFPFFLVMWFGITGLLSYMSGWRGLAEHFRADRPPEGERFRFASGAVGASDLLPVSYNSCLFISVSHNGLQMSLLFLFRFLSPALYIPWSQVVTVTQQRRLFIRYAVVEIRGTTTKIRIMGRAGQAITAAFERYSFTHGDNRPHS